MKRSVQTFLNPFVDRIFSLPIPNGAYDTQRETNHSRWHPLFAPDLPQSILPLSNPLSLRSSLFFSHKLPLRGLGNSRKSPQPLTRTALYCPPPLNSSNSETHPMRCLWLNRRIISCLFFSRCPVFISFGELLPDIFPMQPRSRACKFFLFRPLPLFLFLKNKPRPQVLSPPFTPCLLMEYAPSLLVRLAPHMSSD